MSFTYDSWFNQNKNLTPDLFVGNNIRILKQPSRDCGCPEEEWRFDGSIPLQIHFEEDGSAEAVLCYFEDFDLGQTFKGLSSMSELREVAFSWAKNCIDGQITGEYL